MLSAPVLTPTRGGARPSAALQGGGGVGRGAQLRLGGHPAALSPISPPRAHHLGRWGAAVTAIAACAGAGAAAVPDSAGGIASG